MITNLSKGKEMYFNRNNIGRYRQRLEAVGIKDEEEMLAVMNYIDKAVRIAIEIVRKNEKQGMH